MRLLFEVLGALALVGSFVAQMLRWLRVLQREHYEPSAMSRFLGRWTSPTVAGARSVERARMKRPVTLSHVLIVVLVLALLARALVAVVVVTTAYGVLCPWGLSLRGRTSKLQWTRRLKTIALVSTVASVGVALAGVLLARSWLAAVAMVLAVPLTLDLTSRALAPYEHRHAQRFVDQASARLQRVAPRVVAITGSFGKTSVKNHVAVLLAPDGGVVASPRSFNNRAGLSRAINEHLVDGTRLFIAEMGTYGGGEIRDLCAWCPPDIAIITAIGPVHLERMRSLEAIERAKFEITERASVVVLNVDDERLARWATRLVQSGKRVVTAGAANAEASVRVITGASVWRLELDGAPLGTFDAPIGVQATNLACAVATALECGLEPSRVVGRLGAIRPVANRLNVATAPSGVVVIDDTFNTNPSSAEAAVSVLGSLELPGRRVVVTPGIVEMGAEQYGANLLLARRIEAIGAELVIVGRTNVVPLRSGLAGTARRFDTRDDAVEWVRRELVAGDGVLYLNDLPDHYP